MTAHLQDQAVRLGPSALARRLAAICDQHPKNRLQAPSRDPVMRAPALTEPGKLTRMVGACPGDPAGQRDHALLLLLAAAGLDRTALVGLDVEHANFDHQGTTLRSVVEDRATLAVTVPRAAERRFCLTRVLEDWLQISET